MARKITMDLFKKHEVIDQLPTHSGDDRLKILKSALKAAYDLDDDNLDLKWSSVHNSLVQLRRDIKFGSCKKSDDNNDNNPQNKSANDEEQPAHNNTLDMEDEEEEQLSSNLQGQQQQSAEEHDEVSKSSTDEDIKRH
ncbi:unnamed protein product [Didymodactylos carnosus]|uniref:Uncharacterized protein n=1 Tax=Didymodactylos carnosus TaxID=1234261 RepID=A0A815ZDJ8_9BILA|nr:unnamed protein product [Didymodactylos carnosus]CAF1583642.1 unnamed protein product [Didymodactylos carnosus]CAF3983134.1 unnamed protein product [Didymodactylos carnosus]CAF4452057.1 unnamed protein product [Didymodactylos carnosus]